jgi:PTH1 family peptidyl-tRNA hydrolase
MKLIAGLGNPGAEYAGTRHNAGFEVVELLARRHGIAVNKRNFKAVYGEGTIGGERVLLTRPMTYMNASGEAVAALARYYKLEPSEIIVALDEINLPVGRIRLRYKGSAGGQNGMASVIQHLGTQDVPRIRIGVGGARPGNMVGHVLGRFRPEELPLMQEAYERAADAVECALAEGFEMAMNRFNLAGQKEEKEEAEGK